MVGRHDPLEAFPQACPFDFWRLARPGRDESPRAVRRPGHIERIRSRPADRTPRLPSARPDVPHVEGGGGAVLGGHRLSGLYEGVVPIRPSQVSNLPTFRAPAFWELGGSAPYRGTRHWHGFQYSPLWIAGDSNRPAQAFRHRGGKGRLGYGIRAQPRER